MHYTLCIKNGIPPAGSWEPAGFHMGAHGEAYGSPRGGIYKPGPRSTAGTMIKPSILNKVTFAQSQYGKGCRQRDAIWGSETVMNDLKSDKRKIGFLLRKQNFKLGFV